MKILLTLDFPPEVGGIQKHLENIVRFTYDSEDLVMAGCCRRPSRDFDLGIQARIDWIDGPFSRNNKKYSLLPMMLKYCLRVFSKSELFEVECGNVYAAAVPWVASMLTGISYSVYAHGTELLVLQKKSIQAKIVRRILQNAQKIMANSLYTASLLREAGLTNEIVVMPPKIILPEIKSQTVNSTKLVVDRSFARDMNILCVGRFVAHKGHSILLEAVSMLPGNVPWRLVLVGQGPLYIDLAEQCKANNLQSKVLIKRNLTIEELAAEYEKASVFVLPSVCISEGVEGFGMVLLEAMAHKVPIIASWVGGVSEVLDDGKCGILVEAGNSTAIAHALLELHKDDRKCSELIKNAYQRVTTRYAW
jgi:glycosyltransferase involved in cell wall biosynthesis